MPTHSTIGTAQARASELAALRRRARAALIREGLTDVEIAHVMRTTPEAVRKARSRDRDRRLEPWPWPESPCRPW